MAADLEMDGCGDLGESWVARTVTPAVALHGRRRGGHRRTRNTAHGPRFEEPRASRDGGSEGNPPRPIRRPKGSAEMAVAMAGSRKLVGAHKTGSTGHETRNKLHGEREGRTVKLTAGRNGVDGGSETADHAEADGGFRRTLRRLQWLPRRLANAKKRAGRQ